MGGGGGGGMTSGFEVTRMILTSCWTHSGHSCSIVTNAMYFAWQLCSANQACTECCLEFTALTRQSTVCWAVWGGGGAAYTPQNKTTWNHSYNNTWPSILTLSAACTELPQSPLDRNRKTDCSKQDPQVRKHVIAGLPDAPPPPPPHFAQTQ